MWTIELSSGVTGDPRRPVAIREAAGGSLKSTANFTGSSQYRLIWLTAVASHMFDMDARVLGSHEYSCYYVVKLQVG